MKSFFKHTEKAEADECGLRWSECTTQVQEDKQQVVDVKNLEKPWISTSPKGRSDGKPTQILPNISDNGAKKSGLRA
jgi:hypothetical protein